MFTDNQLLSWFPYLSSIYVLIALVLYLGYATIQDSKELKISNKLNGGFFLLFLALVPFTIEPFVWHVHVLGAVFGFFIVFIPAMVKNVPMGGDIKLFAVLGMVVGYKAMALIVGLSCVLGVVALMLSIFRKGPWVPFAPVVAVSTVLVTIGGMILG